MRSKIIRSISLYSRLLDILAMGFLEIPATQDLLTHGRVGMASVLALMPLCFINITNIPAVRFKHQESACFEE